MKDISLTLILIQLAATSEELMILSAMRTISFVSCIKFEEWDGVRKDYVHFHPHKTRLG